MYPARRIRQRVMALAAFTCVMVLAFCGLGSAPAKAIGGSATDWMSQGKFGVMTHYLAENCPLSSDGPYSCPTSAYNTGIFPTIDQWNTRVNNYDVNGVVQQLKSVGSAECGCWCVRTRCCAGTATFSYAAMLPPPGPSARDGLGPFTPCGPWCCAWRGRTPVGGIGACTANCLSWA